MSMAVEVKRLEKRYGSVLALSDVTFSIPEGRTCALLGGNGAGKTTTLAILLGLLLPTGGEVAVFGEDLLAHRYRVLPRMNFSSPYVDLPHRLTVEENLRVYARLYGVRQIARRLSVLAADLDLGPLLKRSYGGLSAGQKTRVSLAKALVNEPDLLLLDEPTASLDPDTADRIRAYLTEYRQKRRATLLITSHNMQEVERIAERVLMLGRGRLIGEGTPQELIDRFGRNSLEEVFLDVARSA
ncbi:MAG: ABC transporter ATP-binding protein [Acidiferrobacteraceae bacterium]